ncbi:MULTISPECIES: alpha-L-fucosidase [unclassified Cellulophaga]|uniref:alpha-L-fucosidase n=1 Tax=unclassified Cellulophaga TaxID=2634405 RepID=UPI0026E3B357|nr:MULTISPECIES: alpha-L-fucosidase [unclassified Cellulophaga]MDO6492679.1 alpha-L-fucosidase [Cellulophaga sp. 2_MG-2023]MDO6495936.1 alpha-L-fucosidase [Cellulophaga sp. 3_MG-2023]
MKKIILLSAYLVLLLMGCTSQKIKTELPKTTHKYTADWESLQKYKVPEWYKDLKFGIYFHWGPYTVPAYMNEWYSRWMYVDGHPINKYHKKTYGSLDAFGYKDFIPMFKAEKFNADAWADLFVNAGAQFAGPIAEHADGFAMWDSKLTTWDAKDKGPKIDVVGAMEKAIKTRGLKFITTYHRHWLYAWYPTWDKNTDAYTTNFSGLYGPKVPKGTFVMANKPTNPLPDNDFNKEWLNRLTELTTKYDPDIVWFDNKMDIIDEDYRKQFLANFYNQGLKNNKEVVVTYKFKDLAVGSAVLDLERSRMSDKKDFTWLTDDSIDWKSWSNVQNPNYKTTNRLVDFLVDVVSKNGAVLLNITPTAEGEIPAEVKERLLQMGVWLKVNGEAIYGTRTWDIYGEGPAEVVEGHLSEHKNKDNTEKDIRFTTKDDVLYATVLDWPKDEVVIKSLSNKNQKIKQIQLLGSTEDISWEQTAMGLVIQPLKNKVGNYAFVYKIEFY